MILVLFNTIPIRVSEADEESERHQAYLDHVIFSQIIDNILKISEKAERRCFRPIGWINAE